MKRANITFMTISLLLFSVQCFAISDEEVIARVNEMKKWEVLDVLLDFNELVEKASKAESWDKLIAIRGYVQFLGLDMVLLMEEPFDVMNALYITYRPEDKKKVLRHLMKNCKDQACPYIVVGILRYVESMPFVQQKGIEVRFIPGRWK